MITTNSLLYDIIRKGCFSFLTVSERRCDRVGFLRLFMMGLLLALSLIPCPAVATGRRDVVRVGYVEAPEYLTRDTDGQYSGVVYDYLETLAVYAGLQLEYVSGTTEECIERLTLGSVDMLADVVADQLMTDPDFIHSSLAAARTTTFLMLDDGDDDSGSWMPPSMRIGYLAPIHSPGRITSALEQRGIKKERFTLIPYYDEAFLRSDYRASIIDGQIVDAMDTTGKAPTGFSLFTDNIYLTMRRDHVALLHRLDQAAEEIFLASPRFREQLQARHFQSGAPLLLTPAEREYLQDKGVILTASTPGQPPYSYFQDGHHLGVLEDILQLMSLDLGLTFTSRDYSSNEEMLEALRKGRVELVTDFCADYNWAHQKNADLSHAYLTMNYIALSRSGSNLEDAPRIACPRGFYYVQEFVEKNYNKEQLQYYDSIRDCIAAVSEGKADLTFINTMTAQHELLQASYPNISTNNHVVFSHDVSMAVSANADPTLIRILNKEIAHLGQTKINEIVSRHIFSIRRHQTLRTYLQNNPIESISIIAIVSAIIIGFMLNAYRTAKKNERKIYDLTYLDRTTKMQNYNWFTENVPPLIGSAGQARTAGRLYIMALFPQHWDILAATHGHSKLYLGIKKLFDRLQEKHDWIRAVSMASGFSKMHAFIELPPEFSPEDAARIIMGDVTVADIGDLSVHVEYHAGLCQVPPEGEINLPELMNNAETAEREADESGNSVGIYDDRVREKLARVKRIEDLMHPALEREEFQIWLQPKYDIESQKIVGAETLVRWQSEELGFMMPGQFIELFEQNGFIVNFDYYMLEHTCQLQRQRLDQGLKVVPISVNQSGLHMREEGYLTKMQAIVDKYQLPPGVIELELTETAFVDFETKEAQGSAIDIVNALHDMGFTMSMDDFGTGYSSIAMLQTLPMDVMKIDRSLLLSAEKAPRAQEILQVVIELGQRLKMKVLCEGIETKEQEALLLSLGCHIGQGFLFGKPVVDTEFCVRLDNGD